MRNIAQHGDGSFTQAGVPASFGQLCEWIVSSLLIVLPLGSFIGWILSIRYGFFGAAVAVGCLMPLVAVYIVAPLVCRLWLVVLAQFFAYVLTVAAVLLTHFAFQGEASLMLRDVSVLSLATLGFMLYSSALRLIVCRLGVARPR